MSVLVTGGAGYIGSVTAQHLIDLGHQVTIIDNLSTGSKEVLPTKAHFVLGDVANSIVLSRLIDERKIKHIFHFAGSTKVPESIRKPLNYYHNNTAKTLDLLKVCKTHNIEGLIYSSSAAVYGEGHDHPVKEKSRLHPSNPYGSSKLMSERIIKDFAASNKNFNAIILRYFNVAGADKELVRGPSPQSSSLIKLASEALVHGASEFPIYGNDYATPDGTCVRDFIHVRDLASAHHFAFEFMLKNKKTTVFNCGYGHGFSVQDVLDTLHSLSGRSLQLKYEARRPGDVASMVANVDKLKNKTGWRPMFDSLKEICQSSLDWQKSRLHQKAG